MLPPSDRRMPRATRVSPMSRASGTARARWSSLGTTKVSPYGSQSLVKAGAGAVGSGQALVEIDPVGGDAGSTKDLALGGEILQDG